MAASFSIEVLYFSTAVSLFGSLGSLFWDYRTNWLGLLSDGFTS